MFESVLISMSFVSKIEVLFATGSLKLSRAIKQKDCVINLVFVANFCKIDLRARYFSFCSSPVWFVQAVYVGYRLSRDRQLHTANIVHRQAESRSRQPRRDSGTDQFLAVDQLCEPIVNGRSNTTNSKYIKKQNCSQKIYF